jgi:hypothetical protein
MKVLQIDHQEDPTQYEGITNKLARELYNMKVLQTSK